MKPDNCAAAMPVLKKIQPNYSQLKESEALLSYRGSCYFKNAQYSQALSDKEVLRSYFVKAQDQDSVKMVDLEINYLKKAVLKDPRTYTTSNHNDSVSPEFAQKLKAVDGQR